MKKNILFIMGICAPIIVLCQQSIKPISIGDTASNVTFAKVVNFPKTGVALNDFKGKVVILDFWSTTCAPCIRGLPELQKLQEKYKERIQVLPVTNESAESVVSFFKRKQILLPSVVNEIDANYIFPHVTIPHSVIIDANGVVRAITTSANINDKVIDSVLENKTINLFVKKDNTKFRPGTPFINGSVSELQTDELIVSSIVTKGLVGSPSFAALIENDSKTIGMQFTNYCIPQLFLTAMGKPDPWWYCRIVLRNVKDPERYLRDIKGTDAYSMEWDRKHSFCYEIIAPALSASQRNQRMLADLNEAFFQFYGLTVSLQKMKTKCLILKPAGTIKGEKKSSKSIIQLHNMGTDELEFRNLPLERIGQAFESSCGLPIVNETKSSLVVSFSIPFKIVQDVISTGNFELYNSYLKPLGLQLVPGERKCEMLVMTEK